ncbi:hypothetical protein BAE46_05450 [Glaciecola punicea]|jgi:hypothetical protein|uniref:hypothetical protein n=1 Tax=Glaciecola punicea TaxID=56804 RepID=UPI0008732B5B|nr:hypothetical protein [Glaciecola punicea]OFA32461.1 hypothetical protein BAE46_05450 [Glaciecola punicea]
MKELTLIETHETSGGLIWFAPLAVTLFAPTSMSASGIAAAFGIGAGAGMLIGSGMAIFID